MRARVRPAKVLALGWGLGALALTLLIGPELGWRGWFWLGLHDLLVAIGVGWELVVRRDDRSAAG